MSNHLIVHKHRTNVVSVDLGMDVSQDTITGEIRTKPDVDSVKICEWLVNFVTDGTDGLLTLTLDESITVQITQELGYMDLKRVSGGEPLAIFDKPLEVVFQGVVTE